MSESNDDASSIIGGLITLGFAILVSKSNSNNKEQSIKERIRSYQIEEIVNDAYYIDTEDFSENMVGFITLLMYESAYKKCLREE